MQNTDMQNAYRQHSDHRYQEDLYMVGSMDVTSVKGYCLVYILPNTYLILVLEKQEMYEVVLDFYV